MCPRVANRPTLKGRHNDECKHVCKSGTHGAEDQDAKLLFWEDTEIKAEDSDLGHGDDGDIQKFVGEVYLASS
jgi:hypothetical protein